MSVKDCGTLSILILLVLGNKKYCNFIMLLKSIVACIELTIGGTWSTEHQNIFVEYYDNGRQQ